MADVTQAQPARSEETLRGTAILCYILYLVGWPTVHIATIVALVPTCTRCGATSTPRRMQRSSLRPW